MINKLHLVKKTLSLTCAWVSTGNPKMPLVCVWTRSKAAQTADSSSSTNDNERMHLCA